MKFLVDNQLPPALARLIEFELGADAKHVIDVHMRDASDAELWDYASETESIMISKDEDFVRMVLHSPTARLVWVRIGNCRRVVLLNAFRRIWPRIVECLISEDLIVEVR